MGEIFVRRGWTLAVAESCTGGWVTKVISDVPGASRYLLGGAVAYADRAKTVLLDVPPALIESKGAVSEEVARAMAEGVRRVLGADVGLAVTGIAGPEGGSPGKPVGTVWFGLALPGSVRSQTVTLRGGREAVRRGAAGHALGMVFDALESEGPGAVVPPA
ncbi:MAG: CinA family protein [Gemmatimonadetes bacterium]|nr:CinA family protein [Gemmatimonadota bacterium]